MALLAGPAQAKKLQGVKQQAEAGGLIFRQSHIVHGAVLQNHRGAAVDAGEVVFVALCRGEEGLAAGQMAAPDQTPLLQLAKVAINRGEPHGLGALAQQGVQVLAGEFPVGQAQCTQKQLLAGA